MHRRNDGAIALLTGAQFVFHAFALSDVHRNTNDADWLIRFVTNQFDSTDVPMKTSVRPNDPDFGFLWSAVGNQRIGDSTEIVTIIRMYKRHQAAVITR